MQAERHFPNGERLYRKKMTTTMPFLRANAKTDERQGEANRAAPGRAASDPVRF